MRAEQIMTSPVITVRDDRPWREAIAVMTENRVTSLPVLDEDGDLVGMVSEIDVLRSRLAHDPRAHLRGAPPDGRDPGALVRDVMTTSVVCLSGHTDAADVAEVLVTNRIRAVPIIDGGELVGIVSRRDLLRTLLRDDSAIAADVQERLDAYADEAGRWRASVHDGTVTIDGKVADDRVRRVLDSLARTVPGVVRVHLSDTKHPSHT